VGSDLARELSKYFKVVTFDREIPDCDVLMVIKHPLPTILVEEISRKSRIIYCPIDHYGSSAEIDADGLMLRKCSRILVHCESLKRYFQPYAPVEYMDHHVKFVAPMPKKPKASGYFLWIGVRSNLEPLVKWVNENPLPGELRILTNLENPESPPKAENLGFRTDLPIHIKTWTEDRHIESTAGARAVIDIKGGDFRSRHKPPAKAIDFIASGLPMAMNPDCSAVEHLARMGFDVPSPLDFDRWLGKDYWKETQQFGKVMCELYSLERIGRRFRRIIGGVLT
jgi:hypothetical protein